MSIIIKKSKSGNNTVEIKGKLLHSNYSPKKEALRFIDRNIGENNPNLIIILGAGLGYLYEAIKKKYTYTRIFQIFFDANIFHNSFIEDLESHSYWHPKREEKLESLLEYFLKDYDGNKVKILHWKPSILLYPSIAKVSLNVLNDIIRKIQGSLRTIKGFGKKWIENSFKNFITIPKIIKTPVLSTNKLTVLVASGYSLAKYTAFIKKNRDFIQIIALPSALQFLSEKRITPDFIFVTDPGFYSNYHFRFQKINNSVVIMPLSAVTALHNYIKKFHIIYQPHFFEILLLKSIDYKSVNILPQGTVAASAISFIQQHSIDQCLVIGLDFSYKDIHSHVIPNSFYQIQRDQSNRLQSLYSRLYKNSLETASIKINQNINTSVNLKLYADFFNQLQDSQKSKIYLGEKNLLLNGFPIFDFTNFNKQKLNKQPVSYSIDQEFPDQKIRKSIAEKTLNNWKRSLSQKQTSLDSLYLELLEFCDPDNYIKLKHYQQYNDIQKANKYRQHAKENVIIFLELLSLKIQKTGVDY